MGAEIPETCEAVTFPPQTVWGESNETPIKQGGGEEGGTCEKSDWWDI